MDEPQDEQMGEVEEKVETLPLSADERRVLELYDRYQQLQLEIAIMKAQSSIQLCMSLPTFFFPRGRFTDALYSNRGRLTRGPSISAGRVAGCAGAI